MRRIYLLILVPTFVLLSILVPYAYVKINSINSRSPQIIGDVAAMMERGEWRKKR